MLQTSRPFIRNRNNSASLSDCEAEPLEIAGFPHRGTYREPDGTILLTLEWRRTNSALIDPPMNTANELKRALIGQHKPPAQRLVSSVSS